MLQLPVPPLGEDMVGRVDTALILAVSRASGGAVKIMVMGDAAGGIELQTSADLVEWEVGGEAVPIPGEPAWTAPLGEREHFYRATVP